MVLRGVPAGVGFDDRGTEVRGFEVVGGEYRGVVRCDCDEESRLLVVERGVDMRGFETRGDVVRGLDTRGVETRGDVVRGDVVRGLDTRGVETRGVVVRGLETRGADARGAFRVGAGRDEGRCAGRDGA